LNHISTLTALILQETSQWIQLHDLVVGFYIYIYLPVVTFYVSYFYLIYTFNIFVRFPIPPIRKKCPVLNGEQRKLTGSSETIDLQKKAAEKRLCHCKTQLCHSFQLAKAQGLHCSKSSLEILTELSNLSPLGENSEEANSDDASNSDDYDWDNILGGNWHSVQLGNSPATSLFDDEDSIPGLLPVGIDSDSGSGSSSSSANSGDSLVSDILDCDADDELEDDKSDLDEENHAAGHSLGKWDRLWRWVLNEILGMYATHYELPQDGLPCGPSYLHHVLTCLKTEREDHFHEALCINPTTFDVLVSAIEHDPIFTNNSNNSQMPVEEQVAITLYQFGHDGNASGLQAVANWASALQSPIFGYL